MLGRGDLNKTVLKDAPRNYLNTVFPVVQNKLKEVFGFELAELPTKERVLVPGKKAAAASGSSSKNYVLRSTLPSDKMAQLLDWKTELPSMSLLYVILTLILMNNNVLPEGSLFFLYDYYHFFLFGLIPLLFADTVFHYMTMLRVEKDAPNDDFEGNNADKLLKQYVSEQ